MVFGLFSKRKAPIEQRDTPRRQVGGGGRVPSWAGDRSKNEAFVVGIQNLAMGRGVPQQFLQASLSETGTFSALVNHAAEMERQGSSFTDQQVAVSHKLVDMWKSYGAKHTQGVVASRYQDDDGKSGPPSWSGDSDMERDFAAGIQLMSAPDGLSADALMAMFSLPQPLERALAIAGAVERQGGSFKDQQFAAKNFMVKWWGELSPDLQETFANDFG
jgi:hypothetical protein